MILRNCNAYIYKCVIYCKILRNNLQYVVGDSCDIIFYRGNQLLQSIFVLVRIIFEK
jgi:hypothetical protein